MTNPVSIKGGRDGLRLQLDETTPLAELLAALEAQLERGAQFFNGARATIDIGARTLADDELAALLDLIRRNGLQADALLAETRDVRSAARSAGLTARPVIRAPEQDQQSEAIFVQRTVRSGQIVRHQGHITIVGDVNSGAEVIAGGSILVWGRVRGVVHAGALGDRDTTVCALDLQPAQLRIADLITRSPDRRERHGPELARIVDDQISVDEWETHRK